LVGLAVFRNMKYLYAMVDEQTRSWIAEVAETKFTADLRPLFLFPKVFTVSLSEMPF